MGTAFSGPGWLKYGRSHPDAVPFLLLVTVFACFDCFACFVCFWFVLFVCELCYFAFVALRLSYLCIVLLSVCSVCYFNLSFTLLLLSFFDLFIDVLCSA